MIGQVLHTSNIEGIVNYHVKKIENNVAEIIDYKNMNPSSKQNINASFRAYSAFGEDPRPYTHISINFHEEDKKILTDSIYKEIGETYLNELGYKDQPYLLIKHEDQVHPHFHIITTTIKDDGTKISKWGERYRSQNISRTLEIKYNLKEVSSIKNEQKSYEITTKRQYHKYIRSSIKQALAYKPKRKEDLYELLQTKYQIKKHITKSRGISFALCEKEGGKIKQQYDGYGAKGIGGSKIDKKYSYKNIQTQLQSNFKNAPKRYRNLKLTEEAVSKSLEYFEKIKPESFNTIFKDSFLEYYKTENSHLILDNKGNNIYSDKDLKDVDFNKFGLSNIISEKSKVKLFAKMKEEAFWIYKNDISPYLKQSSFLRTIAVQEHYINYLEQSETFIMYNSVLSPELKKEYLDSAKGYIGSFDITSIEKAEDFIEDGQIELLNKFSNSNNINAKELNNLFELNTFKSDYTTFTAAKNTIDLITKIAVFGKEKKGEEIVLSPSVIFQYKDYFSKEDLNNREKIVLDKIVSERYIDVSFRNVSKQMKSHKDFVKSMNNRGVELFFEKNKIEAKIIGYETKIPLKVPTTFFNISTDFQGQNIESNYTDIEFNIAISNENYKKAFILLNSEDISDKIKNEYKEFDPFKTIEQTNDYKNIINTQLYETQFEAKFKYKSEFKEYLKTHIEDFKEIFPKVEDESLFSETFYNSIEKFTSLESINESIRKEKENLTNSIELSSLLKSDAMAGLMGVLALDNNKLSDFNGKYNEIGSLSLDNELKDLQKEKFFEYYSKTFANAAFHLFGDERERRASVSSILVYHEFEKHIPQKLTNDFKNLFSKEYIEHFLNVLETDYSNASNLEKIEFLNSKGIRLIESSNGLEFKLLHQDKSFVVLDPPKITNISTDRQINYFRETQQLSSPELFKQQIAFNVAIDKNDFISAAWMLKRAEVINTLGGLETEKAANLKLAISEIKGDSPIFNDLYSLLKVVQDDIDSPLKNRRRRKKKRNHNL